jgi:hypothetical protein
MSTFHQREIAKLQRVIALYEGVLSIIEHYPTHGDNKGLQYCKNKAEEARIKKQDALDGRILAQIDGRCERKRVI